jgi:D-alanyl-D-alanine carboxypeptidase/Putative peptidoglycan binding domain
MPKMKLRKAKMKYPYIKLVLPKALEKIENGKLTDAMLDKVACGGRMYKPVAVHFNALYKAAQEAGFKLRNVGDFRPFADQMALFQDRYSTKDEGRKPQVTRTYDGKTWYLKPGKAPSSTPGKSNHGLGLAIDLGYDNKGALTAMGGKCLEWMCDNAPKYGFYLQSDDPTSPEFEAWHWQYCLGDKAPEYLAGGVAPSFPGNLQKGSTGDAVKAVQEKLGVSPADGNFGDSTEAAVKAFKEKNGLKPDGVVGSKVWELLF